MAWRANAVYLLAWIFPPIAILVCGKPFQALFCCFLCLLGWFPGVIHAWLVVADTQATERHNHLTATMLYAARLNSPANTTDYGVDPSRTNYASRYRKKSSGIGQVFAGIALALGTAVIMVCGLVAYGYFHFTK